MKNLRPAGWREFHQFGVEMLGSPAAASDAEVISMVFHMFRELGIQASLELNSIGCPTCRARYQKALRDHFATRREDYAIPAKTGWNGIPCGF